MDRQRKKNEVSEGVIKELKKELEKYAIEIIRMQERPDSSSFSAINETFNEDDEDNIMPR